MICKDCDIYAQWSHDKCAERNKDKPTPDCDCLHRLNPAKVLVIRDKSNLDAPKL